MLFVANARPDLAVPNWRDYFFKVTPKINFKINVADVGERAKNVAFVELDDALVREFREYQYRQ